MTSDVEHTDDDRIPLIERFRDYLLLLARMHMGEQFRGKFDASDIVQQTLMEAHAKRGNFRGQSEREMAGWLRQILAFRLTDAMRATSRARRDTAREKALRASIDASGANLEKWLAADQSTPSMRAERHEQLLLLAETLAVLPDGQRDALVMKHCQGLSVTEISEKMGISVPSVIGLIKRGAESIRKRMEATGDEHDSPDS